MPTRGKKYRGAADSIDREMLYSLKDALALAKGTSTTKFDASVEIHMNLGIDPKQADQQLRGTIALPHGTGKKVKVIAFVSDDKVKEAEAAGAIKAGNVELIREIESGWMDFDKAVAEPAMMKELAKIARTLGQAGKMPNPKSGTVGPDVAKMVTDIMKGQVEYRNDKTGNMHNVLGKVSFTDEQLLDNAKAYLAEMVSKKPEKMKGTYINSITLTTSMGPGVKVDIADATA